MTKQTVERGGSSTPITDALYGRKDARRRAKKSPTRNPRHTFSVGASLSPETFTALETLKGQLSEPKPKRRRRRPKAAA